MSWFSRRAAAVLVLGAALAGCNGLDSTDGPEGGAGRVAIGQPAPNVTGEDAEGHALNLADFRGKVVMLSFWSVN
jgi:cytochrome oxidase Cu insertion factor (SCO1/SenC/PrrC family)